MMSNTAKVLTFQ